MALSEIGLPQHEIPLALLMFNVGVELGQLLFVGVMVVLMFLLSKVRFKWPEWIREAPAYGIGSMAAFWFFERVSPDEEMDLNRREDFLNGAVRGEATSCPFCPCRPFSDRRRKSG